MSPDLNLALTIHKIDNINVLIDTEDFDFLLMMRDHFSFFVDGYKFQPKYKNKQWDGKIHLLKNNNTMPIGLTSKIIEFCSRHNKEVFVDPQIKTQTLDVNVLEEFIKSLNIHIDKEPIYPHDYQVNGIQTAIENQRCILISATSSGKSLMQYILLRFYQKIYPDEKMLMIVPTVGLVTQMKADFNDYSSEVDWCSEDYITGFSGGEIDDPDKNIILTTYQSLSNKITKPPPEFFHQFKVIKVDEVHTAQAKSIKDIMNSAINADIRLGLTGTLSECATHEMVLRGMFGDIFNVIATHELMEMDAVAQLKILCALLKYPDKTCKFMRSSDRGDTFKSGKNKGEPKKSKATYQEEIDFIINNQERNKLIMRLTANLSGNTILMIKNIEHGENLYKWMKAALPDRDIYLYIGDTDADQREYIRQVTEKSENCIIIGSIGVLSTGISIKRLHNLVFAHPSKSRIKVLQSIGRIIRKSKFGNLVTMYDFIDDFSIGAYENYTLEHGRIRVGFYHDQKFDCTTKIIDINEGK